MGRGTRSSTAVALALLGTLAVLSLLLWSSSSGAPLLREPTSTWEPDLQPPGPILPATEVPLQTLDTSSLEDSPPEVVEFDWLLVTVLALVLAVAVVVIKALLNRERSTDEPLLVEEDEELNALLEASGDDVRYRALSEADPRNAVVACWVALEDAVRRSGLHDAPAETASELTRRVLARWEVDETSIRTLSQAYREARFSRHPVTEQQRETAVTALEHIHEGLRRRLLAERQREEQERLARQARTSEEQAPGPGGAP